MSFSSCFFFCSSFCFSGPYSLSSEKRSKALNPAVSNITLRIISHFEGVNKLKNGTYRFFSAGYDFENIGRKLCQSCGFLLGSNLFWSIFSYELIRHLGVRFGTLTLTYSSVNFIMWVLVINLYIDSIIIRHTLNPAEVILITFHLLRQSLGGILV